MTETSHHRADSPMSVAPAIKDALRTWHFAHVYADSYELGEDMRRAQRYFVQEWDHLEPDDYLHKGATFRRRRFALFYFNPGTDELLPLLGHAYHQAVEINRYAAGIARNFAPFRPAALDNEYLGQLIRLFYRQLPIEPDRLSHPWQVDVHQIRIIATSDEQGEPTPEGPHHDGEEFGVVQLVQRQNCGGGLSTIYTNDMEPISSFTLLEPLDSLIWWDPHVMHGVSPIHPLDPDQPAIRDALLIGYHPKPLLKRPNSPF